MGNEIVFDYSKAAGFIRDEEVAHLKSAVLGAKVVLTGKPEPEMISLAGLIFRWIMTRKNLQESGRLRKKSSRIRMCFW